MVLDARPVDAGDSDRPSVVQEAVPDGAGDHWVDGIDATDPADDQGATGPAYLSEVLAEIRDGRQGPVLDSKLPRRYGHEVRSNGEIFVFDKDPENPWIADTDFGPMLVEPEPVRWKPVGRVEDNPEVLAALDRGVFRTWERPSEPAKDRPSGDLGLVPTDPEAELLDPDLRASLLADPAFRDRYDRFVEGLDSDAGPSRSS